MSWSQRRRPRSPRCASPASGRGRRSSSVIRSTWTGPSAPACCCRSTGSLGTWSCKAGRTTTTRSRSCSSARVMRSSSHGTRQPRPRRTRRRAGRTSSRRSRCGCGPGAEVGWNSSVFPLLIVTPSGGFTGLFLYSPGPGTGNLIGSWTAAAGTDPYGNAFPQGINVQGGNLAGVTIQSISQLMSPGPFIVDAPADIAIQEFTTVGVNNWVAPAGVTSVTVWCQASGGPGGTGMVAGFGGGGGGGGEVAFEATVAVTPGNTYHPTVGSGPGFATTFAGDSLTVTAHSGQSGSNGGASNPGTGGAGGHGSTNTVHFNGGKGGNGNNNPNSGGGGGGGAASGTQAGNAGSNSPSSGAGGAGGAGSTGTVPGGAGGKGGLHGGHPGANGSAFGGGGGGGGDGGGAAGTQATGRVVLQYSTLANATFFVIAAEAGTDEATGTTFQPGINSFDPVFGDNSRIFGATMVVGGSAVFNLTGASLDVTSVGSGLRVKEGTNAKQGTATLAAGTILVGNTSITASSRILLTAQDNNSTGALRVSARVAGTSFTITSSNGADSGVVAYEIFE